MKQLIAMASAVLLISACKDPGGETPAMDQFSTCLDHLKGHTFELYQIDTQSFRTANGLPSGLKGSIMIDSNASDYRTYVYNQSGDSLTVNRKNSFSSSRTFRISNGIAYWGDDGAIIQTCTETNYNTSTQGSSTIPGSYLKITVYTRRLK